MSPIRINFSDQVLLAFIVHVLIDQYPVDVDKLSVDTEIKHPELLRILNEASTISRAYKGD